MNRQERINRLVARKLQRAGKDKNLCFAGKVICVCMAGAAATPRPQSPVANPRS